MPMTVQSSNFFLCLLNNDSRETLRLMSVGAKHIEAFMNTSGQAVYVLACFWLILELMVAGGNAMELREVLIDGKYLPLDRTDDHDSHLLDLTQATKIKPAPTPIYDQALPSLSSRPEKPMVEKTPTSLQNDLNIIPEGYLKDTIRSAVQISLKGGESNDSIVCRKDKSLCSSRVGFLGNRWLGRGVENDHYTSFHQDHSGLDPYIDIAPIHRESAFHLRLGTGPQNDCEVDDPYKQQIRDREDSVWLTLPANAHHPHPKVLEEPHNSAHVPRGVPIRTLDLISSLETGSLAQPLPSSDSVASNVGLEDQNLQSESAHDVMAANPSNISSSRKSKGDSDERDDNSPLVLVKGLKRQATMSSKELKWNRLRFDSSILTIQNPCVRDKARIERLRSIIESISEKKLMIDESMVQASLHLLQNRMRHRRIRVDTPHQSGVRQKRLREAARKLVFHQDAWLNLWRTRVWGALKVELDFDHRYMSNNALNRLFTAYLFYVDMIDSVIVKNGRPSSVEENSNSIVDATRAFEIARLKFVERGRKNLGGPDGEAAEMMIKKKRNSKIYSVQKIWNYLEFWIAQSELRNPLRDLFTSKGSSHTKGFFNDLFCYSIDHLNQNFPENLKDRFQEKKLDRFPRPQIT